MGGMWLDPPPSPPEACAFDAHLGNRSVFILDPRLVSVRFAKASQIWNLTFALSSLFL